MTQPTPPIAMLVYHRVKDYDPWKQAFDAAQEHRVAASCLGHHISRGLDDPNIVYVYCPATDEAKLKAFADGPELAQAMKDAGVDGPPTTKLMIPISVDYTPGEEHPAVIVDHAVKDYATWRSYYDKDVDLRERNNIVGHAVNHELGKPNQLIVYNQGADADSLRAFATSEELKNIMTTAGVIGTPDIHLVNGIEYQEY